VTWGLVPDDTAMHVNSPLTPEVVGTSNVGHRTQSRAPTRRRAQVGGSRHERVDAAVRIAAANPK
jgi:hypothetical protein